MTLTQLRAFTGWGSGHKLRLATWLQASFMHTFTLFPQSAEPSFDMTQFNRPGCTISRCDSCSRASTSAHEPAMMRSDNSEINPTIFTVQKYSTQPSPNSVNDDKGTSHS